MAIANRSFLVFRETLVSLRAYALVVEPSSVAEAWLLITQSKRFSPIALALSSYAVAVWL